MTELHNLTPFKGSRRNTKRIGRGLGSGHGAYSTRGVKGQKARSGGSAGLKARGMKQIIRSIPKLSGFRSIHKKGKSINLSRLEEMFKTGDTITSRILVQRGALKAPKSGKFVEVKILAEGTLTKAFTVLGCSVSKVAKEKIEKAGGSVQSTIKK